MTASASKDVAVVYPRDISTLYEPFYRGRGKDFAGEAAAVAAVVLERRPHALSVLDVACGTGAHLRGLADRFPDASGLDASPAMCELARRKMPRAVVYQRDMRHFDLGRRFDAVTCLTSTIGYMSTTDELQRAAAAMASHLEPGGILVIDPWWTPEQFLDGYVAADAVRVDDIAVARVSRSTRTGTAVHNEAQYLVADDQGIRRLTHVQELNLYTRAQYLRALEAAGCTAEHVTGLAAFPDRGLYVGIRKLESH